MYISFYKDYRRMTAVTPEARANALACYALALLHGAVLADFEITHLIELAEGVGAKIGPSHIQTLAKVSDEREQHALEFERLKRLEFQRRPWWRKLV